jgi:hypothetical protein
MGAGGDASIASVRGRVPICALALLAILAPSAQAQSTPAQRAALQVYQDYAADGRVDPCKHSSKDLQLALDHVPPDIEQYASEYPSEIQNAIEARARGECAGTKPDAAAPVVAPASGTSTPAPTPSPTAAPTQVPTKTVVPEPPGPDATATAGAAPASAAPTPGATDAELASSDASNDAPLPVLLLGVLVALLALTALLFAVLRRLGIADERLAPVGHAFREARWRAGGTWEDFVDWVRTGR